MTEVRMTLPLLVMTITGLILFTAGWLFGYATFRAELNDLRAIAIEARTLAMKNHDGLYELEKRTIAIEGTAIRAAQDVAEIRLRQLPKGR